MIKAIIADDEMRVCQLIEYLVDWQKLNITVAGIVNTGIDALELILKEKPQIVITDIRMPGYDGIELIRRTHEAGIKTNFIIVSGHRHFEYARTALQYGVQDYILKPIKKEELISALTKVANKCKSASETAETIEKMKEKLAVGRQSMRRRLIADLMKAKLSGDEKLSLDEYGIAFSSKRAAIILHIGQNHDRTLNNLANAKAAEYIENELSKWAEEWAAAPHDGYVAGVFCVREGEDSAAKIKHIFDGCEALLRPFGNFSITMGVSYTDNDKDLGELLLEAVIAARQHFLQAERNIIRFETGFKDGCDYRSLIDDALQVRYVNALQILDLDKTDAVLGRVFFLLAQSKNVTADTVEAALQRILDLTNNVISSFSPENRKYFDKKLLRLTIENSDSLKGLELTVKKELLSHLNKILENQKSMENRPVRLAKQYISEHYMEQINLEDIARMVHLNGVYFSVVFKKETGMNFKDFLTQYRLDIAKDMLKSAESSVTEISEAVGYKDTKYFSKLFAKNVGINPAQYRKLYNG